MTLKIFKPALFTLFALASLQAYSQGTPVSPAQPPAKVTPPVAPEVSPAPDVMPMPKFAPMPKIDDKALREQMTKLRSQMRELQKKMNSLNQEQMAMNMKKWSKNFKYEFKDFGKDFSGSFKGMVPDGKFEFHDMVPPTPNVHVEIPHMSDSFKDFGKNFSYSDSEWAAKIKSGEVSEQVKNYSKSYPVDANDKLEIDNRYGKVTVNTWAKNEFKVDVQIKVATNDDSDTKKLIDNITINDSKDGDVVRFKTRIGSDNDSWGSWISGGKNVVRKIEVNYMIYMPSKNTIDITNKYGATELPDFDGKVLINSAYGSFTAKSLTNADNEISVKYGSANIENITTTDLRVAYGSLVLGSADNLNCNVSFSSAKIGKIRVSGNINVKYSGGLQIADVDKNVKNLQVNASYSSVKLGLSDDQNANFDVTVRYGSFNYGGHDVNITSKSPSDSEKGWSSTQNFKGKLGKGTSDKTITVNASYGSVKFD